MERKRFKLKFISNRLNFRYKMKFKVWPLVDDKLGVYFGNETGFTGEIRLDLSKYEPEPKNSFILAEAIKQIDLEYPQLSL